MIRRLLFGIFWFGLFSVALLVAGGGIAGAMAGGQNSDSSQSFHDGFDQGYQVGVVAGARFRERYGRHVLIVAALLAIGGTATGILPGTKR
jgi:hypothetical protein